LSDLGVVTARFWGLRGLSLSLARSVDDGQSPVIQAGFHANFSNLGFHHGFGLSVTLPRIVGPQRALDLQLSSRRIDGTEAAAIGLVDRLSVRGEERRAQSRASTVRR
jgi:hypothetical protein